jgi:hypothetical protein
MLRLLLNPIILIAVVTFVLLYLCFFYYIVIPKFRNRRNSILNNSSINTKRKNDWSDRDKEYEIGDDGELVEKVKNDDFSMPDTLTGNYHKMEPVVPHRKPNIGNYRKSYQVDDLYLPSDDMFNTSHTFTAMSILQDALNDLSKDQAEDYPNAHYKKLPRKPEDLSGTGKNNMDNESLANLFIYALLAHLIADWMLQNESMALNKTIFLHPSGLIHAGIHVALFMLIFPIHIALLLGVSHYIIDMRFLLREWRKRFRQTTTGLYAPHVEIWQDQVLHIICVGVAVYLL